MSRARSWAGQRVVVVRVGQPGSMHGLRAMVSPESDVHLGHTVVVCAFGGGVDVASWLVVVGFVGLGAFDGE